MTTDATLTGYARRGHQLLARCALETGNPDPAAAAFIDWLLALRPGLRAATWRTYKLSVGHFLEGYPDADAAAAILRLRDVGVPDGPKPPRRTSARRAKKVAPEDLIALLIALGRSSSKYAPALRTWLIAGILTGSRPCEWSTARLEGALLTVRNAKAEEGWRGLGPTRTLDLSALAPYDLSQVERMCGLGARWHDEGEYHDKQIACSSLLRNTCIKLWPTRDRQIALYTARHVFTSNAKASSGQLAEVSAMLGHCSTKTAATRYGKRRDAWKRGAPPSPKVDPMMVAKVRRSVMRFPWADKADLH